MMFPGARFDSIRTASPIRVLLYYRWSECRSVAVDGTRAEWHPQGKDYDGWTELSRMIGSSKSWGRCRDDRVVVDDDKTGTERVEREWLMGASRARGRRKGIDCVDLWGSAVLARSGVDGQGCSVQL